MTFMSSLAANPSGSGSVFGMPGPQRGGDELQFVNNIKDREMNDYKNKANFMADLSIKQDRLRKLYGLDGGAGGQMQQPQGNQSPEQQQQMLNAQDPSKQINPMQQAQLGLQQRGQDLESQRITQQGKMGQEAIDIKQQQADLNQQKSDQINALKTQEAENRRNEAEARLKLQGDTIENLKAYREAMDAWHKTQMEDKDRQHQKDKDQMQANIDALHAQMDRRLDQGDTRLDQAGNKEVTTNVNPEGTKRTVTTKSGSSQDENDPLGIR